jgi:5-methylcytosine-specific restriction endonuclease McrA
MNLKSWNSNALVEGLKVRVQTERKIMSEIIFLIQEIDKRRVYLEHGVTSLFAFLTDVIGYSGSAAGEINLSHVSLLVQGIRQKESDGCVKATSEQKHEILEKIKSKPIERGEVILAKELDLQLKAYDVCHRQKNESLRAEMTFTEDEMAEIKRAQNLVSHQIQNPRLSELFMYLVRDQLKRKDPKNRKITAASAVRQSGTNKPSRYINSSTNTTLHKRDQSCRWKDPKTEKICGSTFQLQRDHIVPIWAGGTNDLENLQLLCGVHNRLKYRLETNSTFTSDYRTEYIFTHAS